MRPFAPSAAATRRRTSAFLSSKRWETLGILWRLHTLSKAIPTAAALFSLMATAIPFTALWLSHGGGIPRPTGCSPAELLEGLQGRRPGRPPA